MINKFNSLQQLMDVLSKVPFFASKNIYKIMNYFLLMKQADLNQFCNSLKEIKENLILCERCFFWKELIGNCYFCDDFKRNNKLICVVESWQELLQIEASNSFNGLYHVLGGLISPIDGIMPESLNINSLFDRLENINELILALSHTVEGDFTINFIANKFKVVGAAKNIKLSCLAKGLPVGSALNYMDKLTINKALIGRVNFFNN